MWDVDLSDTDLDLLDKDIPSKHFVCLQDVFKMSSRHVCLQDAFKTCLQDVFKTCLQDQQVFAGFLLVLHFSYKVLFHSKNTKERVPKL